MDVLMQLSFLDIKPQRLFKVLFWNALFGYLPIWVVTSILTLMNIIPVNFNGEKVYGIKGFIVSLFFFPFIPLVIAGPVWLLFWVARQMRKLLLSLPVSAGEPDNSGTSFVHHIEQAEIKPLPFFIFMIANCFLGYLPFYVLNVLVLSYKGFEANVFGLQLSGAPAFGAITLYWVGAAIILGSIIWLWLVLGNLVRHYFLLVIPGKRVGGV